MRASNDESLFAWEDTSVEKSGLLAPSPASFKYSEDIKSIHPQAINRAAYSMTNKGLQIDFNLTPFEDSGKRVLAPLNCCRNNDEGTLIAVILSKDGLGEDSFERTACGTLASHPIPTNSPNKDGTESLPGPRSVFIKQPHTSSNLGSTCHFKITFTTLIYRDFRLQARQLANPELGRWAKDKVDEIGLKLANNVAVIQFNRHPDKFVLRISTWGDTTTLELLSFKNTWLADGLPAFRLLELVRETRSGWRPRNPSLILDRTTSASCELSETLETGDRVQVTVQERRISRPRHFVIILDCGYA